MNKHTNLAKALYFSLRKNPFSSLVTDYGLSKPITMNRITILSFGLLLSSELKKYDDKRIGIALPPGIAGIIGNLGVIFAGKIPVNLNITAGKKSINSSMKEANIQKMISVQKVMEKFPDFPWATEVMDLSEFLSKYKTRKFFLIGLILKILCFPKATKKNFSINKISNDRTEAVLLFTSGSSSQPKGVILSDQNILSNCKQMFALGLFKKKTTILGNLPLFHSFGLSVGTFFPLLHNLSIAAAPSPLDYKSSLRAIRESDTKVILGTPTFLKGYVRKAAKGDFKNVKYVVAGAERTPPELKELFENKYKCEYLEGYGLTETSPGLSFNLPGLGKKQGSVGKLMEGVEGKTIDPYNGKTLARTSPGILCFRGPNVFKGYLNNKEKNNEVFQDDNWFITGDLGRFDEDGFLFIEGRLTRFSKIGGEMVSHESVEDAVHKILVEDGETTNKVLCAVMGFTDDLKGEGIVLILAKKLDPKWLSNKLREIGLSNISIPRKIVFVEEIPLLSSGKLDLQKIKSLASLS